MSYQRDYILRMIQEFFKALNQILKLKKENQQQKALDLIEEAGRSYLNLDLTLLVEQPDTLNHILADNILDLDKLGILAELLKVKADILLDTYFIFSAKTHYEIALAIFEKIQQESKDYSLDRVNKINEIQKLLLEISQ